MKMILIAVYLWASIWSGLIVSRLYHDDEKNRILGPILWGIGWPVFLPLTGAVRI